MKRTMAVLKTGRASRYLAQLCKHFAHRVDVSWEGDHGERRFAFRGSIGPLAWQPLREAAA